MPATPEILVRILLAIIAGGIIGAEREYRDKVAGFRTIIFYLFWAPAFLPSCQCDWVDSTIRSVSLRTW